MKNVLVVLLLVLSGTVFAEPSFKYCFTGLISNTKEVGCYNGDKNVPFEEWLAHADPKVRFLRAEVISGKSGRPSVIARIWWVWK